MHSFSMRPSKYFYNKPLPKYLDPKTVLIYRPHPVRCTCGCSLTAAVPQLEHLRHDRQVQSAVVEASFLLLVGVVVEGGRQAVWYIVPHSTHTRLNRGYRRHRQQLSNTVIEMQCCGSMKNFWCGFGSADPYVLLMDPDADPDPAIFVADLQDINKNIIFF